MRCSSSVVTRRIRRSLPVDPDPLARASRWLYCRLPEVEKTIQNREQILANLNACTLASLTFTTIRRGCFSPDAAVIAYNANSEITCGDSRLKGNYNATTTWVRRDGKWLVQIHTEIPIKS